jgi:hypothetical protein
VLGRKLGSTGVIIRGGRGRTREALDTNNDLNLLIIHFGYLELPLRRLDLSLGATEFGIDTVLATERNHDVTTHDGLLESVGLRGRPTFHDFALVEAKRRDDAADGTLIQHVL